LPAPAILSTGFTHHRSSGRSDNKELTGGRTLQDIHAFRRNKQDEQRIAGQTAALFLTCGVDLADALSAPVTERKRIALKLERLIERERLRGMRRHWSYDLNRHIALKQTLSQLRRGTNASLDR
jgi:hypothetical protein